jgi:hypothetical protein
VVDTAAVYSSAGGMVNASFPVNITLNEAIHSFAENDL